MSWSKLLFQYGINFNDLPGWQKRGVGLYWEDDEKSAFNPLTNERVIAGRRRVRTNFDLPMKSEYEDFIKGFISQSQTTGVS